MADPTLAIAPDLDLPLEAVTETFAILAKRGKGKTNTAVVMAEEMIGAGLPVVVLDPVGVWWGIRSSADGKAPGLPVVIFGGDHADLPLEEHAGRHRRWRPACSGARGGSPATTSRPPARPRRRCAPRSGARCSGCRGS